MQKRLIGETTLPGDKSISHRALMFLGMSKGQARITNLSGGQDVLSTLSCMKALGCEITAVEPNVYDVRGVESFLPPLDPLDCGNSGTTIRLLSGILAGANLSATMVGDVSLSKRPMKRIIDPLAQMGAQITGQGDIQAAPLQISATSEGLHGVDYTLPMASAQVKSAILLAGLFTPESESVVIHEPLPSRDHTERMLNALGVKVTSFKQEVLLKGRKKDLEAQDITVPGDISSAAFWLVGAAILPGSDLILRQVGMNPSRLGVLHVLSQSGAELTVEGIDVSAGEPMGDLRLTESPPLEGDITIEAEDVPALIDEIPVLTVLGLFTDGVFTLTGAEELRYKESDRLEAMVTIMRTLGIEVESYPDGYTFRGKADWEVPVVVESFETHHDHRLVMALEILNLRAKTPLNILGKEWVGISYPSFYQTLERLLKED